MGLGMGELLVILVIVLLIFGAGKLPQIGDSLGKSIRNFKSSMRHDQDQNAIQNAIEVKKKKELTAGRSAGADDDDDAEVEVAAAPKSKKQQS